MSYLEMITLGAPGGNVAVSAEAVVFVRSTGETSELVFASGETTPLSIDAEAAAQALWGDFLNVTDSGCYNDKHVYAVVPHDGGSRIMLTGGLSFNVPIAVNQTIMTLRQAEANRADLRRKDR